MPGPKQLSSSPHAIFKNSATLPEVVPESLPHAGGGGPRPPAPPRDDDDWQNQPQGHRGPRERLTRYRTGVGAAIGSIYILFAAIVSAYLYREGSGSIVDGRFESHFSPVIVPRLLWVNTVIIAASSLTMEFARRQAFGETAVMSEWLGLSREINKRAFPWLGLTLLLGLAFLAGQYIAWTEMDRAGVFDQRNAAASFFVLFTGLHAVHLFAGLIALLWAVTAGMLGARLDMRRIAIDVSGWYWHAMGLLWLFLFIFLRSQP